MLNVVDSKTQSFRPSSDFARDLSVLFILDERLFYAEKKYWTEIYIQRGWRRMYNID